MIGRPRTRPDTPEEEHRRQQFRDSKRRKAEQKRQRQDHLQEWLDKLMGTGPAERRQALLDAARNLEAAR